MTLTDEVMLHVAAATGGRTRAWHLELGRALAGAVLIDLAWDRRIAVRPGRVTVVAPGLTGNPVQDMALAQLARERRGRTPEVWVERLAPQAFAGAERSLIAHGLLVPVAGSGPLGRWGGRLLPRGGHQVADPAVIPALRSLLRAARPAWASVPGQPALRREPQDPDTIALVSAAVAASVTAASYRLMCAF
jgi:hypothetical protein